MRQNSRSGKVVLQPPSSRTADLARVLLGAMAIAAGAGYGLGVATPAGAEDSATPMIDLSLTTTLLTVGPVHPGHAVAFALVPRNDGPGDAAAGWSVTEAVPQGMTLRSAGGTGYDCGEFSPGIGSPRHAAAEITCVAGPGLVAGTDGAPIEVVAMVDADTSGLLRTEAWVSPAPGDAAETNPLVVPARGTDTSTTATNNDAHADVTVTPVATHPSLRFDQRVSRTVDVNRNGYLDANDEILYEFVVVNTGDVALTGVTVDDGSLTRSGTTVTCPARPLEPGRSMRCEPSAPYRITRADVALGVVLGAPTVRLGQPHRSAKAARPPTGRGTW
ncbi:MAG: hypothetical protein JWQ32_1172 [Marmoricola sp.]|nr:hypothetical protein [Marmoricola sp.]